MAKKPAPKKKKTAAAKKAQVNASQQKTAVLLFALGLLLACLIFIKGDGLWLKLRDLLFGLLGWSIYFTIPICIYFAVMLTKGKSVEFIKTKGIQASILVLLISGAIEVFGELPVEDSLVKVVQQLFLEGAEGKGGGALGIITAGPLSLIGSSPIPEIVILLAMFVFTMLITGSSLIGVYHAIRKPVDSIEAAYADHLETRAVQQAQQEEISDKVDVVKKQKLKWTTEPELSESKFNIDVDISRDKTPEELESIVPLEPVTHDLKDVVLNDPNVTVAGTTDFAPIKEAKLEDTRELRDVRDVLSDWGMDSPVEYISVPKATPVETSTIELEPRPHPLEADIQEAREEDVLKVVQSYLDSIKTNDPQPENVFATPRGNYPDDTDEEIEIETFKTDFSNPENPFTHIPVPLVTAQPTPQPVTTPTVPILTTVAPNTNPWDNVVSKAASQQSRLVADQNTTTTKPTVGEQVFADDGYRLPPSSLLEPSPVVAEEDITTELKENAEKLVSTLESFGVKTKIIDIARGPTVTRYELQPSPGVKISRITGLADDIALNLAAAGIRIEAPIPNKAAVGVEIPNKNVSLVRIRELIDSRAFEKSTAAIAMALGRDITGNQIVADISKMPHMLIAGSTGSGKSVCINSILMSILYKYSPDEVKLLMIDPKVVELGGYNGIPHLLVPVVTDPKKAAGALSWAVVEMLKRYKIFAENSVRDIDGYNSLTHLNDQLEYMPKVVIIIDELADLMMAAPSEVEDSICRLAQMARAAGMHLVIATQRPSVDVITGVIKANIPSRIAFAVSSQIDSRTILDMGGAEKLLGRGDMLFYPVGVAKPMRVQGCFVTDKEVEKVVSYVKKGVKTQYDEGIVEEIERLSLSEATGSNSITDSLDEEDEMIPYAIECVVEAGQGSTSLLQRRLKLGYARAARVIDQLEDRGIVGQFEGSKPRQLLITREQYIEMKLAGLDQPNAARGGKQPEGESINFDQ